MDAMFCFGGLAMTSKDFTNVVACLFHIQYKLSPLLYDRKLPLSVRLLCTSECTLQSTAHYLAGIKQCEQKTSLAIFNATMVCSDPIYGQFRSPTDKLRLFNSFQP